jgi:peptidoglycan hydrolase-like protein with peptidoglycan-binding domain
MKRTVTSFVLTLSFLITPLQSIHGATTTDNTALIQKLLAQIVVLQAELNKLIEAKGGNTTTPTCTFTRTLREGTQGTDVTCLQTYLKKKGHFNGTATGYYGPVTRDAVYKWQQSAGIVPEPTAIGMFGPRSQETLIREMKTQTPAVTTNTTPATETSRKPTKGGGGGTPTKEKTTSPTSPRTKPSTPTNGNNTPTVPVVVPPRTTPPPVVVNPIVLIDFGGTVSGNSFGLTGWSTVLKDRYTDYQALGPGGTTIITSDTAAYNFQGVSGTARAFTTGEKIVVTWYNNSAQAVTVTPKISFNDPDRISTGTAGNWSSMSPVTIPASGTGSSEFAITSQNAGTYSLVNINVNYKNNRIVIADKIVLHPQGASTATTNTSPTSEPSSVPASIPGDTTPPTVTAQTATQNLSAGTRSATLSVTTNENATCKYGTNANTAYSALPTTFTTTGGTSHSVSVSGLTDGSTKKFYVRCIDGSNNVTVSDTVLTVVVATASVVSPSVPTYQTCSAVSPSNAHSHFDSLKNRPGTLRSWALRSDAEIQANGQGRRVESHAYDTQFDGDKLTFNTGSMNSIQQLELPLGRSVGEGVDNSVSVQWEMRFDGSWDDLHGLSNHKAIRLDDDNKIGSTDGRYIEFQHRYGNTADGSVALPTIRTYATTNGGLGSRDPLAISIPNPVGGDGEQDWQPGGQTKAPHRIKYGPQHHAQGPYNTFVILPERWVRTTMTLKFDSGEARLIVTMSDEQTDPVVVIDDPVEPGKGFMVDRAPGPSMIDNIQVEFNSSQEIIFPTPKHAWVRNFVAAANTDLPHGGRPITSTCAGVATRLPTNAPLTGGKTREEFLWSLMVQLKAIQRELDELK